MRKPPDSPVVQETPGFKLVVDPDGTIHAWVLGELETTCGQKIDDMELLVHDGTQTARESCGGCEKRFEKIRHLIR